MKNSKNSQKQTKFDICKAYSFYSYEYD